MKESTRTNHTTTLDPETAVGRTFAISATTVLMAALLVAGCGRKPAPDRTLKPVDDTTTVADAPLSAILDEDMDADEMTPATATETSTPLPPDVPHGPRMTFEAFRQEIEALEANAAFVDALQLCREMAGQFSEPQQQAFVADTIVRLRNNRRESVELSLALQNMKALDSHARSVIWERITQAGDVGRITMRIAVRDYAPEIAEEAGRLLVELRDRRGVDTIIARLAQEPASRLSALFVDVLARDPRILEWNHLRQLCEASPRGGGNQTAIVALVLDALEHSVMTAQTVEADGKPLPATPDWEKLAAATRAELQPEIAQAVLLLVERHPPPVKADDAHTPTVAEQTAARGLALLKRSGYVSVPAVTLERLRHKPSRAAAHHLVDLMQSTADRFTILQLATLATIAANDPDIREPLIALLDQESFRLDAQTLQALCTIIEQDAENRVPAAMALLDALRAWVAPDREQAQNAESTAPDYAMLRLLMSADLQRAVTAALLTLLEHGALPPDAAETARAPVLSDALLARAKTILIAGRFEQLAETALARLMKGPPQPVAAMLVDLLGAIPHRIGQGQAVALCELAAEAGPNRAAAMGLVVDLMTWTAGGGRPIADKPDATTAPDFSTLPARTGGELPAKAVNAMVAYLVDQAAPEADGESDPRATVLLERIRTILAKSGYREIGPALLERLAQQPPEPVAAVLADAMIAIVNDLDVTILEQLAGLAGQAEHSRGAALAILGHAPGRLNATILDALLELAGPPSDRQTDILDILLSGLGWAVGGGRPVTDQPDRLTAPQWKRLPFAIREPLRIKVSETLIDYVVQRATADAETEAEHKAPADILPRVMDVLVSSGCPFIPDALVARLREAPVPEAGQALIDLLGAIPHRIGQDQAVTLCELAAEAGPNRAAAMGLVVDLLTWIAGGGRPIADKPDATTAPDFSTLPARTGGELPAKAVNAMVAYLVDQAAPEADGESDPRATVLLERIRTILAKSGHREIGPALLKRLAQQPPEPVAAVLADAMIAIVNDLDLTILEQLAGLAGQAEHSRGVALAILGHAPGRLNATILDALLDLAGPPADRQTDILDILLSGLGWAVGGGRPVTDQPDRLTAPQWKRLPFAIREPLRIKVSETLIDYVVQRATADAETEAEHKAPADILPRVMDVLVSSGCPFIPDALVARLREAPVPEAGQALIDLLGAIPHRIGQGQAVALCELAAEAGPNRAAAMGLVVDLLTWIAGGGRPVPDKPDATTAPDFSTLPARTGGELAAKAVNAMVAYLVDQAAPEADGESDPRATALIERIRTILVESGYGSVTGKLVARLTTKPTLPVATLLAGLLHEIPDRLTADMVQALSSAAQDAEGPYRDILVDIVIKSMLAKRGSAP